MRKTAVLSVLLGFFLFAFFVAPPQKTLADDVCPGICAGSCGGLSGYVQARSAGGADENYECVDHCCVPAPTAQPTCNSIGGICRDTHCITSGNVEQEVTNPQSVSDSCNLPIHGWVDPTTRRGRGVCCVSAGGHEKAFDCDGVDNPLLVPVCAFQELGTLAGTILETVSVIGVVLSLIMLLYGGYMIITAAEDPQRLERGRATLTWSIVGAVVGASVFVIMQLFGELFNANVFGINQMSVYAQEKVAAPVIQVQVTGRIHAEKDSSVLPDSEVYLYWLHDNSWKLWPGKEYDNQRNPQKVDVYGEYSFLVPPGEYYVKANSEGYYTGESAKFVAEAQPIRMNLYLKQASEVWMLILWGGVIMFVGGVLYFSVKSVLLWNKKRQVKQMVLKKIKKAGEASRTDLPYPTDTK